MIRLLFDMGLPRRACDDLRNEGMDVVHLGALGLARLQDVEIVQLAINERRAIVTLDHDFPRLVALSGERSPSLVHIRENVDRGRAVTLVRAVVRQCASDLTAGCIASVTVGGIRVRRLPIL